MFDRQSYKSKAKKQVNNVFLIFFSILLVDAVLAYPMVTFRSLHPVYGMTSFMSQDMSVYLYRPVIINIVNVLLEYFAVKTCLISVKENRKVTVGELFSGLSFDEFWAYFASTFTAGLVIATVLILTSCMGIAFGYTMPALSSISIFAGWIVAIILGYRYAMVKYIALDDGKRGVIETLKLSAEIMEEHKFDLFIMQLSFFFWYLACVITAGIASLYVRPYVALTEAEAYMDLSGHSFSQETVKDVLNELKQDTSERASTAESQPNTESPDEADAIDKSETDKGENEE